MPSEGFVLVDEVDPRYDIEKPDGSAPLHVVAAEDAAFATSLTPSGELA
jgi:hypothetical protein